MSEELKPCPFCGDTPGGDSHTLTQGFKYGAIECGCSAIGPDVRTGYEDWPAWKDAAISAWNERAELAALKAGQGEAVAWQNWAVGDTVRYLGSGEHGEDCHLCMTIGSDYLIHEAPDEFETMIVLDDDGDEWSVLVGEFEYIAAPPATADAVSVPRELLERLVDILVNPIHYNPSAIDKRAEELRALLAQSQEVKS